MHARKLVLFFCLLVSCGYRLDNVSPREEAETISIPYVEGDLDGKLTKQIIEEIANSGTYVYRREGGDFTLYVNLIDEYDENIGFRYDRSRRGKLQDWVVPVETRSYALAEVRLVRAASCEQRGPARIRADYEYDHDYYTIRNQVNVFSLGQLTDVDTASEVALAPLYKKLAEKIADWVIYGW